MYNQAVRYNHKTAKVTKFSLKHFKVNLCMSHDLSDNKADKMVLPKLRLFLFWTKTWLRKTDMYYRSIKTHQRLKRTLQ